GCTTVSDLTLAAPLVLPERGAVRVQLHVEAPDGQGHRTVALYSRAEDAPEDGPWTAHATGMLSAPENEASPSADPRLQAWPPAGGEPLDLTELYPRLAEQGLGYGPVFQGLTEAFRVGKVVYGRVVLPASVSETAGDYGIHPALLDAALHTLAAVGLASADTPAGEVMLPFAWSDVTLHATGAAELRVCLELSETTATGEATAVLSVADGSGGPVATVGGLQVRRATMAQVRAAAQPTTRDLYRVAWQPVMLPESTPTTNGWAVLGAGDVAGSLGAEARADVPALLAALDAGEQPPERLIVDVTVGPEDVSDLPAAVLGTTASHLETLQALLADSRLASASLVWVTCAAVGTGPMDAATDLVHAPLWGLIRSARSEHADRVLRLVDL
ncbi:MAG: polyketide synthase, partial [Proteobacteria bacterium]|nr:polyketide synthase [Pseudomonadota bacterium]